jgi:hypothetical protein
VQQAFGPRPAHQGAGCKDRDETEHNLQRNSMSFAEGRSEWFMRLPERPYVEGYYQAINGGCAATFSSRRCL